jgi:hypothetical protein
MVSFLGRVAPSEAHRGEKQSTQNRFLESPISNNAYKRRAPSHYSVIFQSTRMFENWRKSSI